jgi:hypothetical protein
VTAFFPKGGNLVRHQRSCPVLFPRIGKMGGRNVAAGWSRVGSTEKQVPRQGAAVSAFRLA